MGSDFHVYTRRGGAYLAAPAIGWPRADEVKLQCFAGWELFDKMF